MSVKKKVIFDFINRFSGTLYSLLLFVFFGLSFLNSRFNFDLPANTKIRDVASISSNLEEATKLSLEKKTESLSNSYVSSVPKTAFYGFTNPVETQHAALASIQASKLFYISNPVPVSDPSVDAGYGVKRYGAKFLYGHSSLAFNRLKTLYVGDLFVVEMDGKVETYKVSRREVLPKSYLDGNAALRNAIYSASYRGKSYTLSLMTCGNGTNDDSSYRLILFAEKI